MALYKDGVMKTAHQGHPETTSFADGQKGKARSFSYDMDASNSRSFAEGQITYDGCSCLFSEEDCWSIDFDGGGE